MFFFQPKVVVSSPHEAELRMLDVFSEFILVLSSKKPLVLIIDGNDTLASYTLFDDIKYIRFAMGRFAHVKATSAFGRVSKGTQI